MILVDDRAGSHNRKDPSKDLARYIRPASAVRLARDLPTDVVFTGWGPGGARVEIGIEYKTLGDVLACIGNGRFAGNQLPELTRYDYAFLLVEGIFRRSSEERGERIEVLCTPAGRPRDWYDTAECGWGQRVWRSVELENWLTTQRLCTRATPCGGVVVLPYSAGKRDSGATVSNLWRWFNDKTFEEHRSHLATDKSHLAPLRGELPLLPRAASEIRGIGTRGAVAVERYFGSLHDAATASAERWAEMPIGGEVRGGKRTRARRLGKKLAAQIVAEIRGESER